MQVIIGDSVLQCADEVMKNVWPQTHAQAVAEGTWAENDGNKKTRESFAKWPDAQHWCIVTDQDHRVYLPTQEE